MSAWKKLLAAPAGGSGLDVDAVFNTTLYNGTSPTAQTITTGMDLDTEDGFLWIKTRSADASHGIVDTLRGPRSKLSPDLTSAATTSDVGKDVSAFTSTGFTLGADNYWNPNHANQQLVAWTFKKTPKFVDIVSYTGNGSTSRTIAHDLGCAIGMIVVKKVNSTSNWGVWHRGTGTIDYTGWNLNTTSGAGQVNPGYESKFTDSVFTPYFVYDSTNGAAGTGNVNGQAYIAYIFAHNDGDGEFGPDSDQDIIKCGSYTGSGGDNNFINIGFEPQWLLTKRTDGTQGVWNLVDNMRSFTTRPNPNTGAAGNYSLRLYANASYSESAYWQQHVDALGFILDSANGDSNANNGTYIYMAIRRGSLFPPEAATEVFAIDTRASSGTNVEPAYRSPFPVDMAIVDRPVTSASTNRNVARLLGDKFLRTDATAAEGAYTTVAFDNMNGISNSSFSSPDTNRLSWMWKRAPSFFDVVAWTGSSSSTANISHNLGVAPQMIWAKNRMDTDSWVCYHEATGNTGTIPLNLTSGFLPDSGAWNNTTPTAATFSVGNGLNYSTSFKYIAYLFATLAGVSKVGSYTGNGSSQTIDCGFTSGAKFILVKRTSPSGNWYIWDTTRGIVAGNDPHLSLNDTVAQVTSDDSIDPANSGFIVNEVSATGINVSSAPYIFYAIA